MAKKVGKSGGTWGHWQVALAYAKYLSPEFHMWCNVVVRERMEGRSVPAIVAGLTAADRSAIGGIIKSVAPAIITEAVAAQLPTLAHEMLPAMITNALASKALMIRKGKTAGQILADHGFTVTRLANWFGNILVKMGCAIAGGGKGELGLTTARLFDPDKASVYMRNGGRLMVERKLAERRGQGALRLVGGKADPPRH